jgi:hypothetical protein
MDPYYFMNLQTKLKDDEDNPFTLNELLTMYPDGTWHINSEDYGHITFRGIDYTDIYYSPTTNRIVCKNRDLTHIYRLNVDLLHV